ncbi:hypothetical protein IU11_15510 [Cellulosimicrobium sp. MM]|nr:hypothetical protein IU11_15510 [Cellulosimicrobium sp. MM]
MAEAEQQVGLGVGRRGRAAAEGERARDDQGGDATVRRGGSLPHGKLLRVRGGRGRGTPSPAGVLVPVAGLDRRAG